MNPTDEIRRNMIICALELLGPKYDTPEARQIMAAIAYQESNFFHRRQIGGPARGFWQFERGGGVIGVMNFPTTKSEAVRLCEHHEILFNSHSIYEALDQNDELAAAFARLLLWTDPRPIPTDADAAWKYYLRNWMPGKPHPNRWPQAWLNAINLWK